MVWKEASGFCEGGSWKSECEGFGFWSKFSDFFWIFQYFRQRKEDFVNWLATAGPIAIKPLKIVLNFFKNHLNRCERCKTVQRKIQNRLKIKSTITRATLKLDFLSTSKKSLEDFFPCSVFEQFTSQTFLFPLFLP